MPIGSEREGTPVMPRIFISYARRDLEHIDRLAARLAAAAHSVFVDRDGIMAGDAWRKRIVEASTQSLGTSGLHEWPSLFSIVPSM